MVSISTLYFSMSMCLPDYLIFCTSGLIIVVFPFALVRHYCVLVLSEMVLRARVFTLCQ